MLKVSNLLKELRKVLNKKNCRSGSLTGRPYKCLGRINWSGPDNRLCLGIFLLVRHRQAAEFFWHQLFAGPRRVLCASSMAPPLRHLQPRILLCTPAPTDHALNLGFRDGQTIAASSTRPPRRLLLRLLCATSNRASSTMPRPRPAVPSI